VNKPELIERRCLRFGGGSTGVGTTAALLHTDLGIGLPIDPDARPGCVLSEAYDTNNVSRQLSVAINGGIYRPPPEDLFISQNRVIGDLVKAFERDHRMAPYARRVKNIRGDTALGCQHQPAVAMLSILTDLPELTARIERKIGHIFDAGVAENELVKHNRRVAMNQPPLFVVLIHGDGAVGHATAVTMPFIFDAIMQQRQQPQFEMVAVIGVGDLTDSNKALNRTALFRTLAMGCDPRRPKTLETWQGTMRLSRAALYDRIYVMTPSNELLGLNGHDTRVIAMAAVASELALGQVPMEPHLINKNYLGSDLDYGPRVWARHGSARLVYSRARTREGLISLGRSRIAESLC